MDETSTPRKLCIAGHQHTPHENAEIVSKVTGTPFKAKRAMSTWMLGNIISFLKIVAPGKKGEVMPIWQKLQYAHVCAVGYCEMPNLDNDRYPIKFEDATPTIRKAYQEYVEAEQQKKKQGGGSFHVVMGSTVVALAAVAVGAWYMNK